MPKLLVIGCASFDTVHLESEDGTATIHTIGGAGLYTALAASKAGAEVVLWGGRPEPMPEPFRAAADLITWIGPCCTPDAMPNLEIVHHGGGRATLLKASWGAEDLLAPERFTEDCSGFDIVHVAALGGAQKQARFLSLARSEGASAISAGTYARAIQENPSAVLRLLKEADIFSMNSNEANLLLGDQSDWVPPAKLILYVTAGKAGVSVYHQGHVTSVNAVESMEIDPTGAGDTFCGAVLAKLAAGSDPVSAAQAAVELAAITVTQPGPAALL